MTTVVSQIEQTIIENARQAVREMNSYVKEDTTETVRAFHRACALCELGLVADSGLSQAAIDELALIEKDAIAVLNRYKK